MFGIAMKKQKDGFIILTTNTWDMDGEVKTVVFIWDIYIYPYIDIFPRIFILLLVASETSSWCMPL
jgi:hypothetical protein